MAAAQVDVANERSLRLGGDEVLDEPSAGLHPDERDAVMDMCRRFIAAGNSVLLVEHDMDLVAQAGASCLTPYETNRRTRQDPGITCGHNTHAHRQKAYP